VIFTKRLARLIGPALCFTALLLFSFTARAQPKAGKGREIAGSVVDVDGNPIAGATVTIGDGGPSATTAADGSFKLTGVATASVAIAITADGFTAKQVPVLGANTALQLQVVLVRPAPAAPPPVETRMVGGVVSDASHAPIAGATVRVHGTQIQGVTAADGSFSLPGVALGEVTLDIEAPNQPAASVVVPTDRAAVVVNLGGALAPAAPATRAIHGKVTESSGEPLAAAQVQVAGIPEATVFTEADGTFVFENLPAGKITLDVTAPEHESHVIEVAPGKEAVLIPLGLASGEQIVIEGRAPSITKQNITGGGSVINGRDLTRVSAPTLDDAMVGKLAGANLQANSGAPGGGAQLRLRGVSTINGQNSPLYVIDGVIISNVATPSGVNAITGAAGGGNPSNQDNPVNRVADLNPNDIENVEVLKGSSAAALYGSKAANGVVIITTKRGKQGENHAEVTQRVGFSQISKGYPVKQWHSIDEVRDAFCDPKDPAACDNNKFVRAYMASGGKNFDHEAEIMRVPFLRETLASVTGGTENGNYYGSVLLADQPGVMQGTFYNKQTGRISVGYKFGDHVKLSMNANLLHSLTDRGLTNNDNAGVSVYNVFSATPSFVDLRPVNGIYPRNPALSQGTNLLQNTAEFQNREDLTRLIAGATTTVDAYASSDNEHRILLRGNVGIDTFDQKNNTLSPPDLIFEQSTGLPGRVIDGTTTNTNMNFGASAVWNFTPHSGGYRSALTAGLTYESVDTHSVYVISRNLIQPKVDTATVVRSVETLLRTKDAGGYLQEELSMLDDRLSLLGGALTERSSLNGNSDKFFFYPKLGVAYSLIKPAKPGEAPRFAGFESLRVRAAYGETGNRPNYGNKFTPLQATNTIGGSATLVVLGNAGDAEIEPERQREFEGGIDMATKDQRIVAEVTGYQRQISNMLLQRALAQSTGFGTQFLNGGGMRNRGVEAALAVKPVKGFDWTTRATLTLNRSEVTELPPGIAPFNTGPSFGAGFGTYRIEVGKSATQIVSTTDGTGALSVVGDGEPDFRIGWSNVINFGDFSLSTLLDWQQGSKVINLTQNYFDANGNATDPVAAKMRTDKLDSGDPRPYIEDGTFLKVREVAVAYSLPRRLASQLGPVKTLQVSLSGRNLLTFTHYSGLDPEVSNFGSQSISRNFDVTPYPPSRTFWLSLTAGI
jgi:TonB-linked SusC/RagA family outer membrane protein